MANGSLIMKITFDHKNICGIISIIAANVIHCFRSLPSSPFGGDFLLLTLFDLVVELEYGEKVAKVHT